MKALAGCSNKEQIIISSHCPQPDSPQQPPSFLTHPSAKMLIGTINDMMRKGLLGLLRRTLIDLQEKLEIYIYNHNKRMDRAHKRYQN